MEKLSGRSFDDGINAGYSHTFVVSCQRCLLLTSGLEIYFSSALPRDEVWPAYTLTSCPSGFSPHWRCGCIYAHPRAMLSSMYSTLVYLAVWRLSIHLHRVLFQLCLFSFAPNGLEILRVEWSKTPSRWMNQKVYGHRWAQDYNRPGSCSNSVLVRAY